VEEALYESVSMRRFVGIDLGREPAPDETTVCKFRHLLEEHGLGRRLFEEVGRYLQSQGLKVSSGTIVDATIISAPSSTKNASGERDPQMKQTMKGRQWYFGMKAHVGVDSKTKLIHSAAANTCQRARLGDAAQFVARQRDPRSTAMPLTAARPRRFAPVAPERPRLHPSQSGRYRKLTRQDRLKNRAKSCVRAKVEHSIGILKRIFAFNKVRYRGIAKNANRLFVTCALANLFMARRHLLRAQGT